MEVEAIREEPRDVPVIETSDVCVVGGSCTGVFAAALALDAGCPVADVDAAALRRTMARQGSIVI